MRTPNSRLNHVLTLLKVDARTLSSLIGVGYGTITGYTKEEEPKNIPIEFLSKLRSVVPISADWILDGDGNMFTDSSFDPENFSKDLKKPHHILEAEQRGIYPEVGDRIKIIRKHYGETQKDFAEAMGIERHTQASIENYRQNPSPFYLKMIYLKYHVNLNWIYIGQGKMLIGDGSGADVDDLMNQIEEKDKIIKHLLKSID